jgi:septum site-determining protein MinD
VSVVETVPSFITIHSNRGGTGKTLIAVNLAAAYASLGANACLLDLDLRAPSISTVFGLSHSRFWFNDFLSGRCTIEETLIDLSDKYHTKGKLLIGPSNPALDAIRDIIEKDKRWEMTALRRLLSVKTDLTHEKVDYVLLDASPGVQYKGEELAVAVTKLA